MSETNNFDTGYQDDNHTNGGPSAGTAQNSTGFGTPPPKAKGGKKGSKLFLLIFVVLIAAALGVVAFMFMGSSAPPPKPAIKAPTAAVEPTSEPVAVPDPALGAAQPALDPITGLPVTSDQVPMQAMDPITGLPVTSDQVPMQALDPITGLPMSDGTVQQNQQNLDAAQSAAMGAAAGVAAAQSVDVDPITGLPMAPTQASQDAAAQAAAAGAAAAVAAQQQQQPQPVAVVQGGDPLSQFRDVLAPIDGRVTVLEGRVETMQNTVNDINGKVDRLLDRSGRTGQIDFSSAPKISATRKAVARKKPTPKAKAKSSNYVRMTDQRYRVAPPVSRVVIVSSATAGNSNQLASEPVSSQPQVSAESCNLQAIVPGRIWVKSDDGSYASYSEGDNWNGQRVEVVDPARGVQVGGRWICN